MFALLHEISHQFFHHDLAYEGVDLKKELAADQNAYFVLTQLTSDFIDPLGDADVTKEIKLAYRLSPIVWLEIEGSRSGITNVIAQKRAQALIERLKPEEHDAMDELLEPEITSDNLARLTITWNDDPDLLIVDGVTMPAKDTKGRALLVTSGLHTVIATRHNAISVNRFSAHADKKLQLLFQPFVAFDGAAMPGLEKQQDWLDILCATSDEMLRPKDGTVGFYHWEALHRLELDGLISIDDWSSIPESKRATYLRWQNGGAPLASWYAGFRPQSPR